jgi:RNA polymerase sigma factor (sigma-70 family)
MDDDSDDRQLLTRYVKHRSQTAFAELVRRHIDLVYAACLRQTHDPSLAEDAAQAVFLILSQRAAALPSTTILAGWLYTTARHAAANARRSETRRARHERKAAMMTSPMTPESNDSESNLVASTLDDALKSLSHTDRNAIILRHFEDKTFRQTADSLGIAEDAAKKRVTRAVEKLRRFFSRRGVELSAAAMAAALTDTHAQTAPAVLVQTVAELPASASANVAAIAKAATFAAGPAKLVALVTSAAALILASALTVQVIRRSVIGPPPAGSPALVPIANGNSSPASAYRLDDREVIKRIPPPYPPERIQLSLRRVYGSKLPDVDLSRHGTTVFDWIEPATLEWWSFTQAQGNVHSVLSLADIHRYQLEMPADLDIQAIPGDWIVRKSATVGERLSAVEDLLLHLPKPVRLERRKVERDVIIIRGIYEFHPIAGMNPPRAIQFGAGDLLHPKIELLGVGGGAGTLKDLFERLADRTNQYVFDETLDGDRRVQWHNRLDGTVNEEDHDEGRDSLLHNLSLQTSLRFTIERRIVDIWFAKSAR